MLLHVFAGQAAANAGAFNGRRVEAVFRKKTANRRAQRIVVLFFQRSLLALGRSRLFGIGFRAGLFARAVALTQAAEDLTREHGGAFVFNDRVQNAIR